VSTFVTTGSSLVVETTEGMFGEDVPLRVLGLFNLMDGVLGFEIEGDGRLRVDGPFDSYVGTGEDVIFRLENMVNPGTTRPLPSFLVSITDTQGRV